MLRLSDQKKWVAVMQVTAEVLHLLQTYVSDELDHDVVTRQQFVDALHQVRSELNPLFDDEHSVDHMCYALIALIDELIIYSEHPHAHEWISAPLQIDFFNENTAGENFFERLTQVRQYTHLNACVILFFYFCLELGFRGKYRHQQSNAIELIQLDIRQQLGIGGEFQIDCHQLIHTHSTHSDQNFRMIYASIFLCGFILVSSYFFFLFNLHSLTRSLNQQLISSVQQLYSHS